MSQFKNIVLLLLLLFAAISCKKKQPHPTDHTPKMAGVHRWHGTERVYSMYTDSIIRYIDDTLNITVVNSKEIITSLNGQTLYYKDANDSILWFSYSRSVGRGDYFTEDITYYFLQDRIKLYARNPNVMISEAYITELETP